MPFEHILSDIWATSPAALDEETSFLAEVAYGHLIHHFSTPASFMTWDEDTPLRFQELLLRVATHHPKVKPTSALRTMLVVLSVKKDIPNAVAFNEDIELLFMMAFKALAASYDRTFTDSVFEALTDSHYVGTKIDHYPHYLKGHLAQALEDDRRRKMDVRILNILKFYLSPFIPAGVNGVKASPALPLYCELVRREPSRYQQSLAFPDSQRRMSPLSPVMEEELSGTVLTYTPEDVEPAVVPDAASTDAEGSLAPAITSFTSFETETAASSVSGPFDNGSQTFSVPSFLSSLTSVASSEAAGAAGYSKCRSLVPMQDGAPPASATQRTEVHAMDTVSSEPSSSASSRSSLSSMHSIRHNPATQLNAVFFGVGGRPAKTLPTRYSAPTWESDPFPDPYSLSPPSNIDAHGPKDSRPETFVHTIDPFPIKQVRQWQANRRGQKAFAESASSKPRSKSKLMLKLNARVASRNFHDHDDSSRLLREGGDATHGRWKRSSLQPWKRLLVLPVSYVRLRIGEICYGHK